MQRFYEVMFIVRPDMADEDLDKLIAGLEQTVTNGGGTLRSTEKLGRRKLAYLVRKFSDGNYVLLTVDRRPAPDRRAGAPPARLRAGDQVHHRAHGRGREAPGEGQGDPAAAGGPVRTGVLISVETSSEPPDRVEAISKVAEAAAFLRRREPYSPASYLMLRGLRWGELRAAIELADPTRLEAPPTDLRRHLKKLLLDKKYEQLLDSAESAMALPCSRAWLDLQRFVVEACDAMGGGLRSGGAGDSLGTEGVDHRHPATARSPCATSCVAIS